MNQSGAVESFPAFLIKTLTLRDVWAPMAAGRVVAPADRGSPVRPWSTTRAWRTAMAKGSVQRNSQASCRRRSLNPEKLRVSTRAGQYRVDVAQLFGLSVWLFLALRRNGTSILKWLEGRDPKNGRCMTLKGAHAVGRRFATRLANLRQCRRRNERHKLRASDFRRRPSESLGHLSRRDGIRSRPEPCPVRLLFLPGCTR